MLSTCIFNIPKTYNDGTPVEPEVRIEIFDEFRRFGGWTVRDAVGMWEDIVEESWIIEIDVPPERIGEVRAVVVAIGERLAQDAMRFTVLPSTTEHIQIERKDRGA